MKAQVEQQRKATDQLISNTRCAAVLDSLLSRFQVMIWSSGSNDIAKRTVNHLASLWKHSFGQGVAAGVPFLTQLPGSIPGCWNRSWQRPSRRRTR